jgi:tRNA modification GTPase
VIRISGREALAVAERVFSGPVRSYASHTAHCGRIVDAQGETVDHVLLLPMLAPRSYTGEDTVEVHCHGGSLITRRVLETILRAGARPARPGEFTFKAFMNGKLDLSQAEAVQELIGAKNALALDAAHQQLEGALSRAIRSFQQELTESAAILEAWVDFPEEGLAFASLEEVASLIETVQTKMEALARTFHEGKMVHEGLSLCLTGPPNAGKSSLMNALLGKDRAIVTDIPGTTRDVLEDELRLGALHFKLLDTAGIRDAEERVEREGIRRSKEAMQRADLILLVMDASRPQTESDAALARAALSERSILVWNKVDLAPPPTHPFSCAHVVQLSAKTGVGLDALRQAIDAVVWRQGPPSKEEVLITSLRHSQALGQAIDASRRLVAGLREEVSPEFLAADMRAMLSALGSIVGTDITEDILTAIFSKFCIGK